MLLFADDIVMLAKDEMKLQKLLDFTNEWCQKWRMKINNDKTKVIHFTKKSTKIADVTFQLGEHELKKVDKYKYLGSISMNILIIRQLQILCQERLVEHWVVLSQDLNPSEMLVSKRRVNYIILG